MTRTMTFQQIAVRLGVRRQTVHYHYKNAMRKLRAHPHELEQLRRLQREIEHARAKGDSE